MSRLIVAPAARDELDAIWDYIGIENGNPGAADRVIEKFFEKFLLLSQQRLMGERCHEFEHLVTGLRQFPAGSYIIYYTPVQDGVHIGHEVEKVPCTVMVDWVSCGCYFSRGNCPNPHTGT